MGNKKVNKPGRAVSSLGAVVHQNPSSFASIFDENVDFSATSDRKNEENAKIYPKNTYSIRYRPRTFDFSVDIAEFKGAIS